LRWISPNLIVFDGVGMVWNLVVFGRIRLSHRRSKFSPVGPRSNLPIFNRVNSDQNLIALG